MKPYDPRTPHAAAYDVITVGKGKTAQRMLVIHLPLPESSRTLPPSKSGKTKIVATTNGNMALEGVTVDGAPVILGLNAYVKA